MAAGGSKPLMAGVGQTCHADRAWVERLLGEGRREGKKLASRVRSGG